MLPSEIEPFAQEYIKELIDVRDAMLAMLNNTTNSSLEIPFETVQKWQFSINQSARALYRFQVCMIDEHKQKERLRQAALNCRLNHK